MKYKLKNHVTVFYYDERGKEVVNLMPLEGATYTQIVAFFDVIAKMIARRLGT